MSKRQDVEAYVHKYIKKMDPSGYNTRYYTDFFAKMSDTMFADWMGEIRTGQTKLYLYAPNMEVTLRMHDLRATADALDVKLFERLKLWDPATRRYYKTKWPYLVLTLPIRRAKQSLMYGMSVPDSDHKVNPLTGQVIKPDKGSSMSMTEAQTLNSKGLTHSLNELLNVRGGNMTAYASFKAQIEETGEGTLQETDQSERVRSAEIAGVYLHAMHLANNL